MSDQRVGPGAVATLVEPAPEVGHLRTWRERTGYWFREQTSLSMAIFFVGALSLFLELGGGLILLAVGGLTPFESIVATWTSDGQRYLLWSAMVTGVVAIVGGMATWKRMPTKSAREGVISGAVLGVQGMLLASIYLWFLGGDVHLFARQFLKFDELPEFMGQFVNGAKNTLILAFSSQALGIALGLTLSLLVLSKRAVTRAPARTFINFMRATPLVWQLIFGYFGFVLGLRIEMSTYSVSILILGLNAGAYTAEIFRAGIQSIERGQLEAARSLGMSYFQSMRYAIIPQAVRRVIPPLMNEFVILIKDTSLVLLLGLTFEQRELMTVGKDAYAETFNSTPFLATAIGYLVVTLPLMRFVTWLEKRLRSGLVGVGA
jgi:polar amino acid transport system permease protein